MLPPIHAFFVPEGSGSSHDRRGFDVGRHRHFCVLHNEKPVVPASGNLYQIRTIGFEAGAGGKRFEMESLAAVYVKALETKGIGRQAVGQASGIRVCFFYRFLCVHSIFYYLCRQQPSLLNHTVILFVRP